MWHTYIVKFLAVEMDCDLMCRDFTLNAPLHLAAKYDHTEIVKFLTLQINCDPTSRSVNNSANFTSRSNEWTFGHSPILSHSAEM